MADPNQGREAQAQVQAETTSAAVEHVPDEPMHDIIAESTEVEPASALGSCEDNDGHRQNDYFETLSHNDSIMHPDVLVTLRNFIAAGGKPQVAVELLSDNYTGYAQMANMLSDWVAIAEGDTNQTGRDDALGAVNDSTKGDQVMLAEFEKVVKSNFDSRKADSIFGEGVGAPWWLERMIQEQEWRTLIYELSESHKNCLLLNFAIQRISEAGHQNEIAHVTSASNHFSVFNNVLREALTKLLSSSEDTFHLHLPNLTKMVCHSQFTYLYTQTVLHSVIASDDVEVGKKEALGRIVQELETAASHRGPAVRQIRSLLTNMTQYPDVNSSLLCMLNDGTTNPGDIARLYKLYTSDNPPPFFFLQHHTVFELLIKDLLNPDKKINSNHLDKYFHLLALASCSTANETPDAADKDKQRERVTLVKRGIQQIHNVCVRNMFTTDVDEAVKIFRDNLKYPLTSLTILHWIRRNLTDRHYYSTGAYDTCTPKYFNMMKEIACLHPLLRSALLDLIGDVLITDTDLDSLDAVVLKKKVLDVLVHLLCVGFALPVLEFVAKWGLSADQSLIRYFMTQLLTWTAGPYSPDVADAIATIILNPATAKALQHQDSKSIVDGFIAEVKKQLSPGDNLVRVLESWS